MSLDTIVMANRFCALIFIVLTPFHMMLFLFLEDIMDRDSVVYILSLAGQGGKTGGCFGYWLYYQMPAGNSFLQKCVLQIHLWNFPNMLKIHISIICPKSTAKRAFISGRCWFRLVKLYWCTLGFEVGQSFCSTNVTNHPHLWLCGLVGAWKIFINYNDLATTPESSKEFFIFPSIVWLAAKNCPIFSIFHNLIEKI